MKPREIERSREKSRVDAMYDPESQLGDPKRRPKDLTSQLGNHRKPRETEKNREKSRVMIFKIPLSLRFYASARGFSALLGSLGEIDF